MQMKIRFRYKSKTSTEIWFESDWFPRKETIIHVDDLEKTGRVIDLLIEDEMGNTWTRKEYLRLNQELEKEPENITVYFDGGFDLNSSLSGLGMVIYYDKGGESFRIRKNERLEELENNNEAEYASLFNALLLLEEIGVKQTPCVIKGDSQVVLKQLEGEWPCYEEELNRWLDRIEKQIKKLGIKTKLEVLNRNENKEADKLASQALQNTMIHSHNRID